MQIGFVGLGRMGANMVHRLRRDAGHAVVAFDPNEQARASVEEYGATTVPALADLASRLEAPRAVWMMVPSGQITEQTIDGLLASLERGDTIVDGATATGTTAWRARSGARSMASASSMPAPAAASGG